MAGTISSLVKDQIFFKLEQVEQAIDPVATVKAEQQAGRNVKQDAHSSQEIPWCCHASGNDGCHVRANSLHDGVSRTCLQEQDLEHTFEKEEAETTFNTMFDSYWWAIITMTTVN